MIDKITKKKLNLIHRCRKVADILIIELERDFGLENIKVGKDTDPESEFYFAMHFKSSGEINLSVKKMTDILKSFIKAKKRGLR